MDTRIAGSEQAAPPEVEHSAGAAGPETAGAAGAVPGEVGPSLVLHVGCGPVNPAKLHPMFRTSGWREVRVDIDPQTTPDVIASSTDLAPFADGMAEAVWCSHSLEHLYAHEVPVALAEFRRVLSPTGFVLIAVPDLQRVAALVAEDRLEDAAYMSPAGPIAPIDMIFGFRPPLAAGNHFMAHRTGFTPTSLGRALREAGFQVCKLWRGSTYELWAIGFLDRAGIDRHAVIWHLCGKRPAPDPATPVVADDPARPESVA